MKYHMFEDVSNLIFQIFQSWRVFMNFMNWIFLCSGKGSLSHSDQCGVRQSDTDWCSACWGRLPDDLSPVEIWPECVYSSETSVIFVYICYLSQCFWSYVRNLQYFVRLCILYGLSETEIDRIEHLNDSPTWMTPSTSLIQLRTSWGAALLMWLVQHTQYSSHRFSPFCFVFDLEKCTTWIWRTWGHDVFLFWGC